MAGSELVHVRLANSNIVISGLKAVDEVEVEISAGVLSDLLLFLNLSAFSLHRNLLLVVTAIPRAHDSADSSVADFGTSSESHACHHHSSHS